jgi:hypothetical protein
MQKALRNASGLKGFASVKYPLLLSPRTSLDDPPRLKKAKKTTDHFY